MNCSYCHFPVTDAAICNSEVYCSLCYDLLVNVLAHPYLLEAHRFWQKEEEAARERKRRLLGRD